MINQPLALLLLAALFVNGCATEKKSANCCHPAMTPMAAGENPAVAAAPVLETPGDWQDDAGKHLQLADLRGQTVLISMFYASCQGVCVITKNDFKAIDASLSPEARAHTTFVLVTLAPDLDTTAVLQAYRSEQGLAENHWRLLRGSAQATAALAMRLRTGYGRDHVGLFRHDSELTAIGPMGNILLQQDGIHADLAEMARIVNATADSTIVQAPPLARANKLF